jgi:hypothetical protein
VSKSKSHKATQQAQPWWSKRRNRNRVWLGLFGTLGVAAVALFVWFATQGENHLAGGEQPIPIGEQVAAFELPDVASGDTFSLADHLGKQDIVIVGYMGFF